MFELVAGILRWVFSKAFLITVLWGIVLSGVAGYLYYLHYMAELPEERRERIEQLTDIDRQVSEARSRAVETRRQFDEVIADTRRELTERREEIEAKGRQLQDLAARLEGLRQFLRRILDPFDRDQREAQRQELEQQQRQTEQELERARQAERELRERLIAVSQEREESLLGLRTEEELLRLQREEKAEEVAGVDRAIAQVRAWLEPFRFWLREAYEKVGWQLILISLVIVFGPILFKIFKYFVLAPVMARARPIRIRTPARGGVDVHPSQVAVGIPLEPGQVAVIKSKFYQASDQLLSKRTKFVFSWRFPFTSLAAGLIELTRVLNPETGRPRELTLSSQAEPEVEMTVIDVPAGGSVILRPSLLAGVVYQADSRPAIKSHWRFFWLHAWMTLQFRYFEFRGPVRLVVWAWRGVRAEVLTERDVKEGNQKRTNQDATIGFTPTLEYSCIRAETFWAYLRGWNPLFDDLFRGRGLFLCQQIARSSRAGRRGRFWESLWNGFTKIFGI